MATLFHPGADWADQVAEGTKECGLLLCQVKVVFVVLVVVADALFVVLVVVNLEVCSRCSDGTELGTFTSSALCPEDGCRSPQDLSFGFMVTTKGHI